jgi:D-alanine-D-alanine ligase
MKPHPEKMQLVEPAAVASSPAAFGRWSRFVRPKGHLSKTALRLLVLLAVAPLVTMVIRTLALPGAVDTGFDGFPISALRSIGSALNQALSLTAISPHERDRVVYLLFVPTCALLVTLARLTFGIRVLGFRSILVAVGFHEAGVVPSLFLIASVVATIVLVRPWLKRIHLPLYARISVILCIVAMTMVGAVLAGPWMRSDALWGVVYFPVIVLGMLAEGIARTLDHDNLVTASWRAVTTILLAFVLSLVGQIPVLRTTLLQFPELVLTQVVAIVLISEFLDLRLFQDWDSKVAGVIAPSLLSKAGRTRVAVVRDHVDDRVIAAPRGASQRTSPSVRGIVDALRDGGHTVKVLEGVPSLLKDLRQFMPPNPRTGEPTGIVFNLAHGMHGLSRTTHVPAMLEMAGIPYTGLTPLGHVLTLDRVIAKSFMQRANILTPPFCVLSRRKDAAEGLQYPLVVKPRYAPTYKWSVVQDREQLEAAVRSVLRRYRQDALVEEYIPGRQISVALVGNDPVECFPLVERVGGDKVCPAALDEHLAERIRREAKAAFRACSCRDYARIEVRVGELGDPYLLEIVTTGILKRSGAFVQAGAQAGYTFSGLMCRIIDVARARYVSADPSRTVQWPLEGDSESEGLLRRSSRRG